MCARLQTPRWVSKIGASIATAGMENRGHISHFLTFVKVRVWRNKSVLSVRPRNNFSYTTGAIQPSGRSEGQKETTVRTRVETVELAKCG